MHVMEGVLIRKYVPRRLLVLYSCCLSFLFLCAFYTYSMTHTGSTRPVQDHSEPDFTLRSYENHLADTVAISNSENIPYTHGKKVLSKFIYGQENLSEPMTDQRFHQSLDIDRVSSVVGQTNVSPKSANSLKGPPSSSERLMTLNKKIRPPNFKESPTVHTFVVDDGSGQIEAVNSSTLKAEKPKLILLWTSFFEVWSYMHSSSFNHCSAYRNCLVTTNRSMLLASDAVIFHARDMSLADLPTLRLPHQRWIFYCLESPPYSDFPGFSFMHNMFNWTMTYRLDSDIGSEYGSVKKIRPKRSTSMASIREVWRRKIKSVVWMSSHCPTHGGRDDFVEELKKYIDIDEYGTCGQLDCPKNLTTNCMQRFARTYKFFLAFENSICKDYVTEKFFRTLTYDIVPVVFGGALYRKIAPPGSYIDALSFKSPKHLAYFLAGVGKDFDLYSTYFEWRKDFAVRLDNQKNCALCSLLHQNNAKHKIYKDLRKWWVQDGACKVWKPNSVFRSVNST